ncbi:MAG TPA: hypothetical protein PKJ03_06780, partial [Methanoregulaceae archaeon]|nr:hypothetical protein [Methanoregulaceae archaeon]
RFLVFIPKEARIWVRFIYSVRNAYKRIILGSPLVPCFEFLLRVYQTFPDITPCVNFQRESIGYDKYAMTPPKRPIIAE